MDILLIEDNQADIDAIAMAFKMYGPELRLKIAKDSLAAETVLANELLPKLILLDLNLPGRSGREILFEIKTQERLKHIPVVILTTSREKADVCATYRLQASCFLVKPFGFQPLLDLVKDLCNFWFKKVEYCPA